MNLVAKEYLASQNPDDPGMPILSCFAGAAHELGEAILVNPNDIEGVAEAIVQGLEMPLGERKERWSAMMTTPAPQRCRCMAPALCRGAGRGSGAVTAGTGQHPAGSGDRNNLAGRRYRRAPTPGSGWSRRAGRCSAFEHLCLRRFRDNRRRDPGLSRHNAATCRCRGIGALAIAAAITGDQIRMTNHPWSFSVPGLRDRLGFERLVAINDFTALALALPLLAEADRMPVGGGAPLAGRTIAVLGPGSGLGVSGLVPRVQADPNGSRWPARAGTRRWRRRPIARAPCST